MPLKIDAATLSGELAQRGYRAKIIPSGRIRNLQEEIESQHPEPYPPIVF